MDRQPSVMEHNFSRVPSADIPRSSFRRPHGLKTCFDAGKLIPIFADEVVPGDTFNLKMSAFGRLATPIFPFMDNLYLTTFFFFVPNRLLWDNFQKFHGEQDNPGDSTDYLIPQVTTPDGGYQIDSMADHFGIPTDVDGLENVNALHFRAYNLIWREWFRDENLQDSPAINKGDGPDADTDYPIRRRAKMHDYFTSCLPTPQKGPAVTLPLGDTAPIQWEQLGGTNLGSKGSPVSINSGDSGQLETIQFNTPFDINSVGLLAQQTADLSQATASTINDIREAFQVQRIFERDARSGTRYTEIVRSHYGVTSPDSRLQRPEYLGGGKTYVNVNPIASTVPTDIGIFPQGQLAGYGTTGFDNHGFTKSFTEHGVILGLICLDADLTYQQGLNRMWTRRTRFDTYYPAFAHLGEQAVLSKEIYCDGTAADQDVFGYQERWAEMRYFPSIITNRFRSNAAQTLDPWHLSQEFETRPVLDSDFIESDPPVDRVIAVPTEPHIILDTYCDLQCARPLPTYSVPGLIDHF